jgi:hypothetical protein
MAATSTGAHVWLRDFELPVIASALAQRRATWRADLSRATRAGDAEAVERAELVLAMLDHLVDKFDRAGERVEAVAL